MKDIDDSFSYPPLTWKDFVYDFRYGLYFVFGLLVGMALSFNAIESTFSELDKNKFAICSMPDDIT